MAANIRVLFCCVLLVFALLPTSRARPKPKADPELHPGEKRLARLLLWSPNEDNDACKIVTDFWNRKCCAPSFDGQPCKCADQEGGLGFC